MKKISVKYFTLIKVTGELLFLYGLLAWTYGVVVQLVYPQWLSWPLSHLTLWLRVDTFTIISFFVSMFGFFMWRLAKEWGDSTHKT